MAIVSAEDTLAGSEDLLWETVSKLFSEFSEGSADTGKAEKKLREYLRKGVKTLQFETKSWQELVNDYADSVFFAVFQGLSDREWLLEADLVLVLDAGIREAFPRSLLAGVKVKEFEDAVLEAHDRAFEEHRFTPILWDAMQEVLVDDVGQKTRRKVCDAVAQGRALAIKAVALGDRPAGECEARAFMSSWVDGTIASLSAATHGRPSDALPESVAVPFFHALVELGSWPVALATSAFPKKQWDFVDFCVHQAYMHHMQGDETGASKKKRKHRGEAPSKEWSKAGRDKEKWSSWKKSRSSRWHDTAAAAAAATG